MGFIHELPTQEMKFTLTQDDEAVHHFFLPCCLHSSKSLSPDSLRLEQKKLLVQTSLASVTWMA